MQESKQEKFPCVQCGAYLVYIPGVNSIRCEYCNHEQAIENSLEQVGAPEYDFEEALQKYKHVSSTSLSLDSKEIQCSGCGAVSLVSDHSIRCPFCGSPIIVELHDSISRVSPESLLPFSIDKSAAQSSFLHWLKTRWFAPNDLYNRAQKDGMDGIYLPFWTYDTKTFTQYRGEKGVYYEEDESNFSANGNRQARRVKKIRWFPASGKINLNFDDVLVCASQSIPHELIDPLEPWDLKSLQPFNSKYLSGFITERYKIGLKEGFEHAKEKIDRLIVEEIKREIGGDTQRIHTKSVKYSGTTFKHILLPLWISSFRYRDKVFRILVNARNGEVSGERPYSWIKISIAILTVILGIILLNYYIYY